MPVDSREATRPVMIFEVGATLKIGFSSRKEVPCFEIIQE